jgi:phage repressor protein C with HTH and peptisase S24 domain
MTVSAATAYFKGSLRPLRVDCENPVLEVNSLALEQAEPVTGHSKQQALTHEQIWTALDQLAERAGLSASGLARKAGLDPTTFNKSKRITADGHERWPSTESIARALAATDSSIDSFVRLIGDPDRATRLIPLLSFAQAANDGALDERGFPDGEARSEIALPSAEDEHAYALEISGDAMRPAYRDGDIVVVAPATPIQRGDRVVVKTSEGELMICEMKRRTARTLELQALDSKGAEHTLAASDVAWVARIIWVKQ